jgi:hypothetical protein
MQAECSMSGHVRLSDRICKPLLEARGLGRAVMCATDMETWEGLDWEPGPS